MKNISLDIEKIATTAPIIYKRVATTIDFLRPYFPEICPTGTVKIAITKKNTIVTQF